MFRQLFLVLVCISASLFSQAQLFDQSNGFSRADTLRGSITKERAWWDVLHYDLQVQFNTENKTLEGINLITFKVLEDANLMQLDLQQPLEIKEISWGDAQLNFTREGAVIWIAFPYELKAGNMESITVVYGGTPRVARNAPWDGGVIWAKDDSGKPWTSVACQGLGASVWYPVKDHQYDEPDSATMHIQVPRGVTAVSNGRLIGKVENIDGTDTWSWTVTNPINSYNFVPYIGDYSNYHTTYEGENGLLDVDLWFLSADMDKAKSHVLPDVFRTLEAFEYWFGPYPFYEDGFKMVHAPHLGMEHQSAIAYGNQFKKGYLGMDLSGTGAGKDWDYIVIHESGHEWFGNNISTKDIADMWVHEGFTDYSETLFVEYWYGKEQANRYIQGQRNSISNDTPIIGTYNVNSEGSGDMYSKGANLIHTIRQVMDNDTLFREILRGLNSDYYHQTVTSRQIEEYFSQKSAMDLSRIFSQYLRTTRIPVFEYKITGDKNQPVLDYRWANIVKGMNMPLDVMITDSWERITPTPEWQSMQLPKGFDVKNGIRYDSNYYILSQTVK
jgi:aminopeptidase N